MAIQNSFTDSSKKYCFLIIISIVVFVVFIEFFLRSVVIKLPRSTPNLIDRVYQSELTNIVVGDSQMYRAFITGSDYVNLARRGNPIPAVDITLRKYLYDKKPEKVIVQASPQLFAKPQITRNTQRYDKYFNINGYPLKLYIFERGITEFMGSFKSLKQIFNVYNSQADEDLHANNEYWLALSERQRQQRTSARVEHHLPDMSSDASLQFQNTYRKMLDFLVTKGSDICMVTPPVTDMYQKYSNELEPFEKAMSFFAEVSKEYKLKLISQNDLSIAFSDEFFINQDHVTPGASKEYAAATIKACFDQ